MKPIRRARALHCPLSRWRGEAARLQATGLRAAERPSALREGRGLLGEAQLSLATAGVRVAQDVRSAFGRTTLTRRAVRVGLSRQRERREQQCRALGCSQRVNCGMRRVA